MTSFIKKLIRDESGQSLTEYALILALIAVVVTGAIIALKDQIVAVFNNITTALQTG